MTSVYFITFRYDKNECTAKGIIKIKERVGKVQEIPSTLDGEKDIKQEPAVLNR